MTDNLADTASTHVRGCVQCNDFFGDKWVRCGFCAKYAHTKCVYLWGIKTENITHVNWLCNLCFEELPSLRQFKSEMKELKNHLKEVTSKVTDMMKKVDRNLDRLVEYGNRMNEAIESLVTSVSAETAGFERPWSEVVKRRKKTKKNLLVVTGTDESPVTEMKTELSHALEGIQISDTRFTILCPALSCSCGVVSLGNKLEYSSATFLTRMVSRVARFF